MNRTSGATPANVENEKLTALELSIYFGLISVLWLLFPKTFSFSDPVIYLGLAHDLPNLLSWDFDRPFDHRLALIFMHWVSLRLLGVTTFSSYLPQIILFAGLIFSVFQKVPSRIGRIYAFLILLILFPQTVTIFPDLGAATFMFFAVITLEQRGISPRGVLFTVFAFVAFLFKETAIFIIPCYIFAIREDIHNKKYLDKNFKNFYLTTVIFGFAILIAYFTLYHIITGDSLSRFRTVEGYGDQHLWANRSRKDLVDRLFIQPHQFLLGYVGASLVLALLGCLYAFYTNTKDRMMAFYFLASLLLFVFFSASFESYTPLPLIDRMVAFLMPPLAVLAANVLPALSTNITDRVSGKAVTVTLFLALAFHWSVTQIARDFYQGKASRLHEMRQKIASAIGGDPEVQLFFAEGRTPSTLNVYAGFQELDPTRMHVCPSMPELLQAEKAFVFVDFERAGFLTASYGEKTCAPDLIESAKEAGYKTLVDEKSLFVAQR